MYASGEGMSWGMSLSSVYSDVGWETALGVSTETSFFLSSRSSLRSTAVRDAFISSSRKDSCWTSRPTKNERKRRSRQKQTIEKNQQQRERNWERRKRMCWVRRSRRHVSTLSFELSWIYLSLYHLSVPIHFKAVGSSTCLLFYLSICLSIFSSTYLSAPGSICIPRLYVSMFSVSLCICLSICTSLSIFLSIYINKEICLFISLHHPNNSCDMFSLLASATRNSWSPSIPLSVPSFLVSSFLTC